MLWEGVCCTSTYKETTSEQFQPDLLSAGRWSDSLKISTTGRPSSVSSCSTRIWKKSCSGPIVKKIERIGWIIYKTMFLESPLTLFNCRLNIVFTRSNLNYSNLEKINKITNYEQINSCFIAVKLTSTSIYHLIFDFSFIPRIWKYSAHGL